MDKSAEQRRIEGWLYRDKYNGDKKADLTNDLKRLAAGEPLAYVIGFVDFLNCRIDLSAHPLIPRAETEFWTEILIKEIKKRKGSRVSQQIQCLDMFAGSGCVGVAVLKNCPNTFVDFVEKDEKLVVQIAKNIRLNKISLDRNRVFQSDMFAEIERWQPGTKYDFIFANPPYISPACRGRLEPSVEKWEPAGALFADDNGLSLIKKFINQVGDYLAPEAQVWLEFGFGQKGIIEKMLKAKKFSNIKFGRDQYDRPRFVSFQKRYN